MSDLSAFTRDQLLEARSIEFVRLLSGLSQRAKESGAPARLSDSLDLSHAAETFQQRWPRSLDSDLMAKAMTLSFKAAASPGAVGDAQWSALAVTKPVISSFVELSRPASLPGKLLPRATRTPCNVSVPVATGAGSYAWAGEGAPKIVGNMQWQSATLGITKASGILVVTSELFDLVAPGSEVALRNEMIRGLSQYLDMQLTDPAVVAVSGVNPASITANAPSFGSAGTSAANAATDVKKMISQFTQTNPDSSSLAILTSPGIATAIAVAVNSTTLGPDGGALYGVPVYTGATGSRLIILDPSQLLIADDGALDVTISRYGSVELNTAPSSPPTASTAYVSLFQAGLVGLKIDRFINYKMARPSAVLYSVVNYA
jgi:hypothetical protein